MRILVVEDQKEIRDFLKQSLEQECFAVDAVADGNTGSEYAKNNSYDVLILDNNLPGKTGMEICKSLREDRNRVPILILSVESDIPKKIELLNSGADDYLTKPFSFDELMARIRAIIRRPWDIRVEEYRIDDLVLNVSRHQVVRGKKEIHLTKKEFMILEQLMRSEGNVVSRGSLLEHVWDMEGDIFSNTIETHMVTLRKKIDSAGKRKLIHTISGRGYKISINR